MRHGPTDWNARKLLQGRADIALSASGRALVGGWKLPEGVDFAGVYASPLVRAVETAEILCGGGREIRLDERLVEMSFGIWEGESLVDLRYRLRFLFDRLEGKGLDFCSVGGESPRVVGERVLGFLRGVYFDYGGEGDILCICHRGVIRSLYAIGSGWDMLGGSDGLDMGSLQVFGFDGENVSIEKLNAYKLAPE